MAEDGRKLQRQLEQDASVLILAARTGTYETSTFQANERLAANR